MGYQFVENLKNARDCIIREYEDTDVSQLPDERYSIRLTYFDQEQLLAERAAYDKQYEAFRKEVARLWDIVDDIYRTKKKKMDYIDLAGKLQSRIDKKKIKFGLKTEDYTPTSQVWDEITFVMPEDTEVQKFNRSYINEKNKIKQQLIIMKDKLIKTFENQNPIERVAVEDRLNFLWQQFNRYEYNINPYHIQPGIVLDIDITSIKRKKYTLNSMANVLNEFLHGVSKGFMDAAFASYSRRRSTVRADIDQTFTAASEYKAETNISIYGDSTSKAPEGIVDVTKDSDGLTEI
jgi:hypothetical protein